MADLSVHGILLLLALFQVKHALADGPLQTTRMVKDKGYYMRPAGLAHAAIHGAGSLAVLVFFGVAVLPAFILAAAETVVHYHIDFVKESLARRRNWSQEKPVFWWALMTDQMLHQLTYLLMTFAVTRI